MTVFALFASLFATLAFAADPSFKLGAEIEKEIEKVKIPKTVELTFTPGEKAETVTLNLTGAGIREKESLITVKVYVASSYADVKDLSMETDPYKTVAKSRAKLLRMNLLRAMPAELLKQSFYDALKINLKEGKVDQAPFSTLLESIPKKLPAGLPAGAEVVLMGFENNDNTETVFIQVPKDSITGKAEGFSFDFWQIWLGKPIDELMGKLKSQLVGRK